MVLTLEVVGQQASKLGASVRKVFSGSGGSIGRVAENDWVLPDPYISSKHARVDFRDGTYYLVDTSTNGVFLNSQDNRLNRSQPYPLSNGDRIFIDAYEIRVSIAGPVSQSPSPLSDMFGSGAVPSNPATSQPAAFTGQADRSGASRGTFAPGTTFPIPGDPFAPPSSFHRPFVPSDPIPSDPFSSGSRPGIPANATLGGGSGALSDFGDDSADVSDPLKLLGLDSKPASAPVPRAEDLAGRSPLSDHYIPPAPMQPKPTPASRPIDPFSGGGGVGGSAIPDDYDPLSDALSAAAAPATSNKKPVAPPVAPTAPIAPNVQAAIPPVIPAATPASIPSTANTPRTPSAPRPTPGGGMRAAPPAQPVAPPLARPAPRSAAAKSAPSIDSTGNTGRQVDLTTLLTGAGLAESHITPELVENFGRILRVVVAGLMDVLRARERIKDEFRMRMTTFKAMDNNPLKFSANVDDALHNLLVKRNAAYLGPVEAFEDAFQDVRNHQMAMLAGVRVAFEAMLSEFDPERLREQFDKHGKKGGLLAASAKTRYWEMYNEKFRGMVSDQESTFRDLFGEEFARAYEEQLERLKAVSRANNKS